jgi:uncharacterized protein YbjT (DUF2867 family)
VTAPVHVIGAAGRSGVALVRSLLAERIPVTAVVRDEARWLATGLKCPHRIADLTEPPTLRGALMEAERVVSVAHARHIPEILAAAKRAKRFVFLGSTRKFSRWPDEHGQGVTAGEASFLASGRHGVILHPTMIYGAAGEDNVQRLAALLRRLPVVPLPGGGRALVQPIHQDDVTKALRAALGVAWEGPHSMVIAGPESVAYADFVRAVAAAAGLAPPRMASAPLAPLIAAARLARAVPGLPKVRDAELRRLLEDKAFAIDEMERALQVHPIGLAEGLARTFG